MKVLLDEQLDPRVAQRLQHRGYDVVAIQMHPGLRGLPDGLVLKLAVEEGRVLVTRNISDFVRLHQDRIARGEHHCGILLVHSRRFPDGPDVIGNLVAALERRLGMGIDLRDTYDFL